MSDESGSDSDSGYESPTCVSAVGPAAGPAAGPAVGPALLLKRKIAAVLAEDKKCRYPGVTEGLYTLADLAEFNRLGHGIPMIRTAKEWRFERAKSDAEFGRRLKKIAPFLEGLDLRRLKLRLAGGAVSAILMGSPAPDDYAEQFHDYDFFLVGHDSDLMAKTAIVQLGEHLQTKWGHVEVYRTQNCITFYTPGVRAGRITDPIIVQVILRRYSTEAEVIHGFDMGSSAMMWDGQRIVMTALGKLAAENGANVLNLAARRASYERRLARYFERGFDLVLPDLDGAALVANGGRLPYLEVRLAGKGRLSQEEECTCRLNAYFLQATRPELGDAKHPSGEPEEMPESDYGFGQIAYGKLDAILIRNVRALSQGKPEALCAYGKYTKDMDIFSLETFLEAPLFVDAIESCFSPSGATNTMRLRDLLGPDGTAHLILGLLQDGKTPRRQDILPLSVPRLVTLREKSAIPFAFMAVEDKTALTGPFTREVVSAKEWYGAAHHGL